MSLRIFSAGILATLLAACGGNTTPEPDGEQIECAIGAGAELEPVCTLEHVSADELVIHHPGGGFRRFLRDDQNPMQLIAADGAQGLEYVESETQAEFALDNEKYRVETRLLAYSPNE